MSMANPVKNLAGREWNEAITAGKNHWYSELDSQNSRVIVLYRNRRASPYLLVGASHKDRGQGTHRTDNGKQQGLTPAGLGALGEAGEIGHVDGQGRKEANHDIEGLQGSKRPCGPRFNCRWAVN